MRWRRRPDDVIDRLIAEKRAKLPAARAGDIDESARARSLARRQEADTLKAHGNRILTGDVDARRIKIVR